MSTVWVGDGARSGCGEERGEGGDAGGVVPALGPGPFRPDSSACRPFPGSVPLKPGLRHDSPKAQVPRPLAAVSLSPVDGADTGHSVVVTDALGQEPVSDLPGKHGRVLPLVIPDLLHHLGGGHLGLRAPYHSRPDAASLVVPTPIENPKEVPSKQVGSSGRNLARDSRSPPRLLGRGWGGCESCPQGRPPTRCSRHCLFPLRG